MRNIALFLVAVILGTAAGAAYLFIDGDLATIADGEPRAPATRPPASPEVVALVAEANALLDNWKGRGEMLIGAGQKLFEAATRIEGDDPELRLALARLHMRMGYLSGDRHVPGTIEKALAEIDRALALDPRFARAHNIRGNILLTAKRLDEAEASFKRASDYGLDDAALLYNRARLLWLREEKDQAADLYRMVLMRFAGDKLTAAGACASLQIYHTQRLERGDAQYYYVRQTVLDPDSAWAHGNWANYVLFGFYDFDDAIVAARKALAIMDYGKVRRDLAMALYAKWGYLLVYKRQKEEAQKYFDEARRLLPDLQEVVRESEGWPVMDLAVLAITQPDSPLVTGRLSSNRR